MGQNAHQPPEDVEDSLRLFGEFVVPELAKLGNLSDAKTKETVTA
jgi:hypothetical protein